MIIKYFVILIGINCTHYYITIDMASEEKSQTYADVVKSNNNDSEA